MRVSVAGIGLNGEVATRSFFADVVFFLLVVAGVVVVVVVVVEGAGSSILITRADLDLRAPDGALKVEL